MLIIIEDIYICVCILIYIYIYLKNKKKCTKRPSALIISNISAFDFLCVKYNQTHVRVCI